MEAKAQDFRTGNYVNVLICTNEQQQIVDVMCDCINTYDAECVGYEFIKPIPLTEQWLLQCKRNSIFNNGFEYKITSTGRFEIYVGVSLITVIEFVHELQNLNFALLGEDVVFDN